jgi:ATP-binding cassette, subfamily B, vacuolar membrane transporter HMT1/ACLQ
MAQWTSASRSNFPACTTLADEHTPLLNGYAHENGTMVLPSATENGRATGNGMFTKAEIPTGAANTHANGGAGPAAPADSAAFYRPTTAQARSWWEYFRGYSLFFPYLWPSSSFSLQVIVIVCFALVLAQRVMNILVPIQTGLVTNLLAAAREDYEDGIKPQMPWLQICLLILYKLVQSQSGILEAARSVLWIPVAQHSYAALSTASFEHVHGLSLEFHLSKRTGEVISALSKGAAINVFLEKVTFQVLPMLIDLGVAIVYFASAFDLYYSLAVSILTFWYLYLTIRLAQWRAEARREMINADREEDAVKNDSLQSYETVKYFGAEDYEFERYQEAVCVFPKGRVQGDSFLADYEPCTEFGIHARFPYCRSHLRLSNHIWTTQGWRIYLTSHVYGSTPRTTKLFWSFLSKRAECND